MIQVFLCPANALLLQSAHGNRSCAPDLATFGKWQALLTPPWMLSTSFEKMHNKRTENMYAIANIFLVQYNNLAGKIISSDSS